MPFDGQIGPPAVLHDPLIANSNNPAAASHNLDGMGDASGGADYS
jgi:hypothetical protein